MEEIKAKEHGHLAKVKVAMAWRLGWRADPNGILCLGKCRKRGDLDRELEHFDFVLLLNKEAWQGLNEAQKRALVDHELCHAQVVIDADGNPKIDDCDRPVCRIRKHDCEEFRCIVERHGLWTSDLAAIAQGAINDAKRTLFDATVDEVEKPNGQANGKPNWRTTPIDQLGLKTSDCNKLRSAGIYTAGELQDRMTAEGTWWARQINGVGEAAKTRIEDIFNEWALRNVKDDAEAVESGEAV
jgi:hypothetical protein